MWKMWANCSVGSGEAMNVPRDIETRDDELIASALRQFNAFSLKACGFSSQSVERPRERHFKILSRTGTGRLSIIIEVVLGGIFSI